MLERLKRAFFPERPHVPSLPATDFSATFVDYPTTTLAMQRMDECTGGVSLLELAYLAYLAKRRAACQIFEIGTSMGRTTLNMALNLAPGGHIYSLDLPPGIIPHESRYAPAQDAEIKQLPRAAFLQPYLPGLPVTLLQGDSTAFDFSPWSGRMDLVFVDGGHVRSVLESDTTNAFKLIKPSGMILWHDYTQPACPEVTGYLEALARRYPLRYFRGTHLAVLQASPG